MQFHWWDYDIPGAVDALGWLADQRAAGRIRHLGVTNFDTPSMTALLDAGLPIVSHQVQYSLLDQRPSRRMQALCAARGVALLCYGTVAGGFLSERYLDTPPPREPLENRSLVKYRLVIDEAGGWPQLQRLLAVLAELARRRGCGVGAVAVAWVLQRPQVAAAIVGARHASHLSRERWLPHRSCSTATKSRPSTMRSVKARPCPTMSTRSNASRADVMPRSCAYELNSGGARDPGLVAREGSGSAG